MNFRHLLSKQSINRLSRLKPRTSSPRFICSSYSASTIPSQNSPSPSFHGNSSISDPTGSSFFRRQLHSSPEIKSTALAVNLDSIQNDTEESNDTMNEFLSRFVYLMRGKLNAAYPECNKQTIDGMLLVIVEKVVEEMEKGTLGTMLGESMSNSAAPSSDFSVDLWKTVWEVSNTVCEDMDKERKKEQMKKFLQSEEVKVMARFASEVGIRGDMLRELKFKWAREKMEENEFYEKLKELKLKEDEADSSVQEQGDEEAENGESVDKMKVVTLPKRKGKIKYNIYGLDLSDPKWKDVADKLHDAKEALWPKEAKPITGKCKLVTEKILSMEKEDDPIPLLAEWVELLQPSRADWDTLLHRLRELNAELYYKVAERVLDEPTFETTIRDFSKLIDAYAKEARVEDAERILTKMNENSIQPDILILTILVHMYSKANNIDRAKQAYETLKSNGFKPNKQIYTSMIMAYVNSGEPALGLQLLREMENRGIEQTEEIHMVLLRAFAQEGNDSSAQQVSTFLQLSGFQLNQESCTLLVEASARAGKLNQARQHFDYMIKIGIKPDDKSVAAMLAAYKHGNLLDKALKLLLELEKKGFVPGVATYTCLLEWLAEMKLIDEAEQVLDKISRLGETPPLKIQVSLCDMYSRAKNEKKTLQALKAVQAKMDELGSEDYERVIKGLFSGGFTKEAEKMRRFMKDWGFAESISLELFIRSVSQKVMARK